MPNSLVDRTYVWIVGAAAMPRDARELRLIAIAPLGLGFVGTLDLGFHPRLHAYAPPGLLISEV